MKNLGIGLLILGLIFQPAMLLADEKAPAPSKKIAEAENDSPELGKADDAGIDKDDVTPQGAEDLKNLDATLEEDLNKEGEDVAPAEEAQKAPVVAPVKKAEQ